MPTIDEIISHNKATGHHFFDTKTMKCFNSRVSSTTFGNYFVTSERQPSYQGIMFPRYYKVRYYNPENGNIITISQAPNVFRTLKQALREALWNYNEDQRIETINRRNRWRTHLEQRRIIMITELKPGLINKYEIRSTHDACIKPCVMLTNGASFLKDYEEAIDFIEAHRGDNYQIEILTVDRRPRC